MTEVAYGPKSTGHTTLRSERVVQFQSKTIKSPASRTVVGNVSKLLTVTND